ncbi:MAG: TRAP transporter substrate-binding protein DctP [Rhodospirillaceae bacterium]
MLGLQGAPATALTLKAAHEYGVGMLEIRHRMLVVLAREVEQSGTGLRIKIYPEGRLFSPEEAYLGLKSRTLEIATFPLERIAGVNPLFAMPSMPGLAAHGQAGEALGNQPLMALVRKALADDGLHVLADVWVPGTFASRGGCILRPGDLDGETLAIAGRPVEALAEGLGGDLAPKRPDSQPGAILSGGGADAIAVAEMDLLKPDATNALSCVTMTTDYVPFYIYHPILIRSDVWDALSRQERSALERSAASAERFASKSLARSVESKTEIFAKAGIRWQTIDRDAYQEWVQIGRDAMRRVVAVVDPVAANALGSVLVLPAPPQPVEPGAGEDPSSINIPALPGAADLAPSASEQPLEPAPSPSPGIVETGADAGTSTVVGAPFPAPNPASSIPPPAVAPVTGLPATPPPQAAPAVNGDPFILLPLEEIRP